jgi:hypothetical protein
MPEEDEIPCVTQVPLTYGDSRKDIEPQLMLHIHETIVLQFNGWTPIATIRGGIWINHVTGEEVTEDQLRIEVWVPRSRVPVFRDLVRWIGMKTRQKQMFVIIPEARVDRLNIHDSDADVLGS